MRTSKETEKEGYENDEQNRTIEKNAARERNEIETPSISKAS
jgi:hypothetical protein